MDEIDHLLRRKPWEPEPRVDYVPEDALTAVMNPCMMGAASCETTLKPIDTACMCGVHIFRPKIGYRLADIPVHRGD